MKRNNKKTEKLTLKLETVRSLETTIRPLDDARLAGVVGGENRTTSQCTQCQTLL